MNLGIRQYAVNSYKSGMVAEVEEASPHRLIQMLYEGGLQRIAFAKGALMRNQIAEKGENISRAIAIIGGLRSSLDLSQGEIAQNLDNLYEYMERRLLEANLKNDVAILDEISGLLKEIKLAWDAVGGA
ncbi:MAG: flagellar export chaperone FliS [Methylomicrobium sp.]